MQICTIMMVFLGWWWAFRRSSNNINQFNTCYYYLQRSILSIKQKGISSSRKPKHTTNHLVNNSPGSNIIFKDSHLPNAEVECAIVVLHLTAAIDCYESIRSKNERIIEKAPFNQEAAAKTHQ